MLFTIRLSSASLRERLGPRPLSIRLRDTSVWSDPLSQRVTPSKLMRIVLPTMRLCVPPNDHARFEPADHGVVTEDAVVGVGDGDPLVADVDALEADVVRVDDEDRAPKAADRDVLDAAAADAGELDSRVVVEAHVAVANRDVVVAAVLDRPADVDGERVTAKVESHARGADDQATGARAGQVALERRVLGEHLAAADRLRRGCCGEHRPQRQGTGNRDDETTCSAHLTLLLETPVAQDSHDSRLSSAGPLCGIDAVQPIAVSCSAPRPRR